ncbi:ketoacyl-ACP synthase III [Clostridium sp. 19966]|uniref:beta-ketoacyl-ACP synthase III n=1 Tax=Clostridium sp. 19966 TaxID=2768166 RepID=UPI0028E092EB|nr:beta-ketoacyl-ACP synthase III [Clostridium sp. 19966]MDT8716256.1 ketoacyl-ACP synthase III [Clostridium sp. 19966]
MKEAIILGTGRYVPERIVTNDDLSKIVDTSDEWISSRTGIKERRVSTKESNAEMAYYAALQALKEADINNEDLELIIVATITPDTYTPSTACIVQKLLEAHRAVAFDVNAACSGFIYSLSIAKQFISAGIYKNALIIGSELLSKIVDWSDRNTCVLFGDGAGAAVLGSSEKKGIYDVILGADGSKGDSLICDAIPLSNAFTDEAKEVNKGSFVKMEGREVFKFATSKIIESIQILLEKYSVSIEEIAYIIPHQANYRIIDFAAKKLNVDISKFYIDLDKYGNTSSASIPIALDEMNKKSMLKKNDKIIMVGFGGGLTYGATLVEWR